MPYHWDIDPGFDLERQDDPIMGMQDSWGYRPPAPLPFGLYDPWKWDPEEGQFGLTPRPTALGYEPDIYTVGAGYQQAMREALPDWSYRPRVRSYIESLEQPLLGQYYGAMSRAKVPETFEDFQDWLLKRPGRDIMPTDPLATGQLQPKLPVRSEYLGGVGAFARPYAGRGAMRVDPQTQTVTDAPGTRLGETPLSIQDWENIANVAREVSTTDPEERIPEGPWGTIFTENPQEEVAQALASLAMYDKRARSPMGRMRQRGITRARDIWEMPGADRSELDWLGYILGGGKEVAPTWMTPGVAR